MTPGLVEELKPEVEKALPGVEAQEPEPLIREVFGSASAQFRVSAADAAAEAPAPNVELTDDADSPTT